MFAQLKRVINRNAPLPELHHPKRLGLTPDDRWLVGLCLVCSFSIGWLIALPFWLVVLVGLLYSITTIGDSPVYSTALTELVPPRFIGAAYSLRSVLGLGTRVISPLMFGVVLERS